jgi:uncharacterized protein (TIGR03435 family)
MATKISKPLHKDYSFWIVVVTLVMAANVIQLQYGIPWLSGKINAVKPAPRVQGDSGDAQFAEAGLDTTKKTHAWQVPRSQPNLLDTTHPQVVLIPTEFTPPSGGWMTSKPDKTMGIRMPAASVMQAAYSWPVRRIVWADPAPSGQFDFIANLSPGALTSLQDEIKKQWSLVGERQNVRTNVLVLNVQRTNAPGFQPADATDAPARGTIRMPVTSLFSILENRLRIPIVDQTGLTGIYDLQVSTLQGPAGMDRLEEIRQFLNEQLGLGVVETNMVIEMLVVKKATQ